MKQRRFTVWTCLVATVVLLVGCLQDKVGGVRIYSEPNAELYSISNQVSLFLFHASGPWKAESPVPWLQVLKETGPGGTDTLKVMTCEKNLTGVERSALVTLVSDGELRTVEIKQRNEYAEFDREEFNLPMEPLMILAVGKGIEKIELVPSGADEPRAYYRRDGIHYVPKVRLNDLILNHA